MAHTLVVGEQAPSRRATIDPAAWIDDHGDYLYRYAMVQVRDPQVAEDLIQETMLAALQACDRFAGRCTERTWLVGILRHKIIDYYRKASRERRIDSIPLMPDDQEEVFSTTGPWAGHWKKGKGPAAWEGDPEAELEQREFWDVLKRCLEGLPPRTAHVFWMREVEGLTSEEICKELDITATNLWVILHRARMQLRRSLEQHWFGVAENKA